MKQAISEILLTQVQPLSEFELIRILQNEPYELLSERALRGSLSLFQTHFLLFHCLYVLREQWRGEGFSDLRIEPLAIELQPLADGHNKGLLSTDPLAEYYLDISHLKETSGDDVEALLDGFWRRFSNDVVTVSADERSQAMMIMDVQTMPENERQLKRLYRQQVHHKHPDKGGSSDAMQSLQWAYGVLRQVLQNGIRS